MAYRTDAFGGKKPESWADFWDTKAFPGSRSLPHPDADLPELEFALLADGVPMDKLYPLDVDRAFKVAGPDQGVACKKFWDTGTLPGVLLSRKEVMMSTVWHGRLARSDQAGRPGRRTSSTAHAGSARAMPSPRAPPTSTPPTSSSTSRCAPRSRPTWRRSSRRTRSSPVAYDKLPEDERTQPGGCAGVLRQGVRPGHRVVAEERRRRHQALAGVGSWLTSDCCSTVRRRRPASPAQAGTGKSLSVVALRKTYGDVVAVDEASMEIAAGEFVTFLGASGSGKTTTLMMIAGFARARLRHHHRRRTVTSTRLAPQKRGLGFVFQQYLLFPHMTVGENVAFPLQLRGVPKAEIRRRVGETLEIVGPGRVRRPLARASCPAASSSASRCAGRWSTARR